MSQIVVVGAIGRWHFLSLNHASVRSLNKIFRQEVVLEGYWCRDAKTCIGGPSSLWAEVLSKCPLGEAFVRPGRARDNPLRADRRVSRLAARETCSLWAQLGGKVIPTCLLLIYWCLGRLGSLDTQATHIHKHQLSIRTFIFVWKRSGCALTVRRT